MSTLSAQMRSRYRSDGFAFPIPAISTARAQACRQALEDAERAAADPGALSLLRGLPNILLPAIDALGHDPGIVEPVSELLGPDLLLWSAGFFIKEASTGSYVSWHQDLNYWGLDQTDEVTAWIALTDATRDNGAMRFIPGSHRARIGHHDTFAGDNLLSRGQEIAVDVDESQAVDVLLKAGEMSLHHGLLVHASPPNRSQDRRIGLALRYITPGMRQVVGGRDYASLVRGEDRHGHFQPYSRPVEVLAPQDLISAARVKADREQFLFRGAERSGRD